MGSVPSASLKVGAQGKDGQSVFNQIIEDWRWQKYWGSNSGVDDVYVKGKRATALIFWARSPWDSTKGLCSPSLGFCVGYSNIGDQHKMTLSETANARESFASFVESDFNSQGLFSTLGRLIGRVRSSQTTTSVQGAKSEELPAYNENGMPQPPKVNDFATQEIIVTLPELGLPLALVRRDASPGKLQQTERMKDELTCWGVKSKLQPQGCSGELVFAYHEETDPVWYVLRRCSTSCEPGFKNETVLALRKDSGRWLLYAGGVIDGPPEEVQRLARLIENAALVHLRF